MIGQYSTTRTIECVLTEARHRLQADGCILEPSPDGCTVIPPDQLATGDYVKVRLWLPGEATVIIIQLAEVQWVKGHWFAVEAIQMNPNERRRLKQWIVAAQSLSSNQLSVFSDQVLIRA